MAPDLDSLPSTSGRSAEAAAAASRAARQAAAAGAVLATAGEDTIASLVTSACAVALLWRVPIWHTNR